MTKKAENSVIQQGIEDFVLRSIPLYDEEQTIAFVMMKFNLFYDEAREHFEIVKKKIK